MPDEIKVSRPQTQPQQQYSRPEPTMDRPEPKSRVSKLPWIILGVVVVVLIILGLVFRSQLFGKPATGGQAAGGAATSSKPSDYVAVFLTNGQVYFGRLKNPDGDYVTLNDIYYLQVGPQQGSATAASDASTTPQQISLVKLGNELHGPVDEMHISRAQVLFYEQLKSDGQVVKAILQDKAAAAAPAASAPAQQQPAQQQVPAQQQAPAPTK